MMKLWFLLKRTKESWEGYPNRRNWKIYHGKKCMIMAMWWYDPEKSDFWALWKAEKDLLKYLGYMIEKSHQGDWYLHCDITRWLEPPKKPVILIKEHRNDGKTIEDLKVIDPNKPRYQKWQIQKIMDYVGRLNSFFAGIKFIKESRARHDHVCKRCIIEKVLDKTKEVERIVSGCVDVSVIHTLSDWGKDSSGNYLCYYHTEELQKQIGIKIVEWRPNNLLPEDLYFN